MSTWTLPADHYTLAGYARELATFGSVHRFGWLKLTTIPGEWFLPDEWCVSEEIVGGFYSYYHRDRNEALAQFAEMAAKQIERLGWIRLLRA